MIKTSTFSKRNEYQNKKAKGQVVGDFIQLHTDSVVGFVKMSNYNNSNNVSSMVLSDDMRERAYRGQFE